MNKVVVHMPESERHLRVVRKIGGKTYYVTIQQAREAAPVGKGKINLPKGSLPGSPPVSPSHRGAVPEYVQIHSMTRVEPVFENSKIEAYVLSPRALERRNKKIANRQKKIYNAQLKEESRKLKLVRQEFAYETDPDKIPIGVGLRPQAKAVIKLKDSQLEKITAKLSTQLSGLSKKHSFRIEKLPLTIWCCENFAFEGWGEVREYVRKAWPKSRFIPGRMPDKPNEGLISDYQEVIDQLSQQVGNSLPQLVDMGMICTCRMCDAALQSKCTSLQLKSVILKWKDSASLKILHWIDDSAEANVREDRLNEDY